jgi:carboxypeptidase PM20D1
LLRVIKRLLLGCFAVLLLLAAALLANTWRQGSRQVQVAALAPMAVDAAAVAQSMAAAVRAKTVSGLLDPAGVAIEFQNLREHLATRYPLLHKSLTREIVGEHSLLYTWKGSDAAALPLLLLAHQDVVPIAPGTEGLWKKPPFSGVVEDGMVWGRGTLDNKSNLITQLEAVEALLQAGYKPRRTVYLFAGHDEEVGGKQGAQALAAQFKQRGIRLGLVLDEGLVITEGILPGLKQPLALIGLAEKGSTTLRLTANAKPGHSSMPPAAGGSAIGMLAAAVARLEAQPMPGGVRGAAADMFAAVAPELPLAQRLALSNLWLLRPVVENMLAKSPSTNAMMRTTTALTVFNAGNKDNVLPGQADALVNFRILPGDTVASVLAHAKRVVADERIEIKAQGWADEPSPISSASSDSFRLIEKTIREVFPGALVAPGLMLAASDARHFKDVADQTYRFMPIRFKPEDLALPHGTDERISVDQLAQMVRFYFRFVQQAAT